MSKKASKKKVKKLNINKQWTPALAGIFTTLIILLMLNSQYLLSSYIGLTYSPIDASAQDAQPSKVLDATDSAPKILISSIEVEAPIDFSQQSIDEVSFQESLKNGVVHYPFTAKPGEPGNSVIFGHSSGHIRYPY